MQELIDQYGENVVEVMGCMAVMALLGSCAYMYRHIIMSLLEALMFR